MRLSWQRKLGRPILAVSQIRNGSPAKGSLTLLGGRVEAESQVEDRMVLDDGCRSPPTYQAGRQSWGYWSWKPGQGGWRLVLCSI